MSGLLRMDSAELRAAQPAVAALAEIVATVASRLGAALDAEGSCWGDDEVGHAFGDAYRPAAQQVRAALGQAAARLGDIGDAVGALADVAETADDQARQRLA